MIEFDTPGKDRMLRRIAYMVLYALMLCSVLDDCVREAAWTSKDAGVLTEGHRKRSSFFPFRALGWMERVPRHRFCGVTHVDYLSLDVEGAETAVLSGFDLARVTVDVITVEDNYGERAKFDAILGPTHDCVGRIGDCDLLYVRRQP